MGQHRFDVEDLLLESDVSDQTVFIATDVEYGQFTDLVYGIEGRLQFSPVVKSILLNHSSPAVQGLIGLRVQRSEGPQCAVADDIKRGQAQFQTTGN